MITLRIVKRGKPEAWIVAETELFAARELQRYIQKISGAVLPVQRRLPAGVQPAIVIGRCNRVTLPGVRLAEQEYIIQCRGRRLFLVGQDRLATLHAVYTFLEEHLGCSWCGLGPEGETVPRRQTVAVGPIRKRYRPDLPIRGMSDTDVWHNFYFGITRHKPADSEIIRMLDWMVRNRMNTAMISLEMFARRRVFILREAREKRGLRLIAGIHTSWLPPSRYFKAHPEYYALVNGRRVPAGHLCWSNPAVARVAAANIQAYLKQYPGLDVIGLSPGDGAGFCTCPNCLKLEGGERYGFLLGKVTGMHQLSKVYLTYCNRVVAQVARHYPRQRFFALCYGGYVEPPLDLRFRAHPNLDLNLAYRGFGPFDNRPLVQGFSSEEDVLLTRTEKAWLTETPGMLKRWRQVGRGRIFSHDYHMNQHNSLLRPLYLAIPRDMEFYRKIGLQGYYSQGCTAGFDLYGLNYYAAARSAFDTRRAPRDQVPDYCRGFYGGAAPAMTRYYLALAEAFRGRPLVQGGGQAAELLALHPDLTKAPRQYLAEALQQAVTPLERRRVRRAVVGWDYTCRMGELIAACEQARKTLQACEFDQGLRMIQLVQRRGASVRAYVKRHMLKQGLCDLISLDKIMKYAAEIGLGRRFVNRSEAFHPDALFRKK